MDINASCLSMMDLTAHHCRVGVGLHLKTCYTVSVDVAVLKVTLKQRGDISQRCTVWVELTRLNTADVYLPCRDRR